MRIIFFVFFVFVNSQATAQKIQGSANMEYIFLLDKEGKTIDTISARAGFVSELGILKVYDYHKGSLPDNCPINWIFEWSYNFKNNKFSLIEKRQIKFYNIGCGSFFNEDNIYCFYIIGLKLRGKILLIEVEDSEEHKEIIKIETALFNNKKQLKAIRKRLNEILLKPACIEVSD